MRNSSTPSANSCVLVSTLPIVKFTVVVLRPVQMRVPVPPSPGTDEVIRPPRFTKSPVSDVGSPILKSVRNSSGGKTKLMLRKNSLIGLSKEKVTNAGSVLSRSRNEVAPNGWVFVVLKVTSTPPRDVVPPNGVPDPNAKSDVINAADALPAKAKIRHKGISNWPSRFEVRFIRALRVGFVFAFI